MSDDAHRPEDDRRDDVQGDDVQGDEVHGDEVHGDEASSDPGAVGEETLPGVTPPAAEGAGAAAGAAGPGSGADPADDPSRADAATATPPLPPVTPPAATEPPPRKTFVTSRPVAVSMVVLATVVFGFFSYQRLPVTLMPEMSYPTLTVRTEYPGAAPEEVENDVSRPVEEALGVIGGLRRISSISRAGISDVVLEFSWDTEVADATQETLEKLDLVFLPDEAERPLVLHYDPALDPVLELSLSGRGERFEGKEGLRRLRRLADYQIKRQLEPIKGVAAVRVRGGLEEEIHVLLDEERLRRTGLSIQRVIDRLRQENINVAGGTIKEGRTEYMVRTLNEYEDLEQIADTVVTRIDGRDVRVRDLGVVRRGQKDRELITRTEGAESVQIDVYKEADGNIVDLAERVRAAIGDFDPDDPQQVAALESAGPAGGRDGRGGGRGGGGPPPGAGSGGPGGPGGPAAPTGLAADLYKQEGARLQVVADRSLFIDASIDEVIQAAVFGGLLAILVLYLFLRNFRSTAIVGISIPVSLFITFAPMNVLGISLNVMSLGGLALGIGMLVDSSIVVLESIFRCREEGDGIVAAAIRGTEEVRGAVVASTLTSIAVFAPMVFVEGVAGEAFGDLGLAVVISLLASLAVAVGFIPMLASRRFFFGGEDGESPIRLRTWYGGHTARRSLGLLPSLRLRRRGGGGGVLYALSWPLRLLGWVVMAIFGLLAFLLVTLVLEPVAKALLLLVFALVWAWRKLLAPAFRWTFTILGKPLLWAADKLLSGAGSAYPRVLRWALARPLAVLLIVVAVFAVTWLAATGLGSELLPEVHQGEFTFEVDLPVGTPLEETDEVLEPVEEAILAERQHIDSLILSVGFDAANSRRSDEGEHSARFKVLLDGSDPALEEAVIRRIRRRLERVPDLDARVTRPVLFSTRTPIEVEVHGDDLSRLRDYGDRVRDVMAGMPQLADVETSLVSGAPEVQIVYDRDLLSRYGLDVRSVAEQVRNQVQGFEATKYNLQDRRVPIVVRLAEGDRESVDDVANLLVNPGEGLPIQLSAVADVELGEGPSEVRRIDGQRVAVVSANLASGSLGEAVAAIEDRLDAAVDWPTDMTYFMGGQNEEWERSRGSLYLALGLSIFLVYVIMAAQFESLLQPFIIMFTIPLAFFGTVLALWLLDIPLSIVVFLGMIMLAGIVVNNAIVLVDYVNTLRARGMERREALVTAGSVRLRPILMTTATTVLGLLPLALGVGDGAELRTPMAIAVISGLITSTVLTLVVIPSIYDMIDGLRQRVLGGGDESAGESERRARDEAGRQEAGRDRYAGERRPERGDLLPEAG